MVDRTERDATPGRTDLREAIDHRLNRIEAANTERSMAVALEEFESFLRRERGVDTLDELATRDCRRFAQHLFDRAHAPDDEDDALAASTAIQYYERVRATCSWWVRDGMLDTNPAKDRQATEELPTDSDNPDQQVWTDRQRQVLLRHTDRRVNEVLDEAAAGEAGPDERLQVFRDRTLAYLLAWSGVRGGEILRDPADDRRCGVTWGDVAADGVLNLLGKTREREAAPLRENVRERLANWRQELDPPHEGWPIFPTLHKGTLTRYLRDDDRGYSHDPAYPSDAAVRERLDYYADHEFVPPAISTNAGRQVMQRLTEDAPDLDLDEGYLKPHGGRRGLGDAVYEDDPALAQDVLRHESIETTDEFYRDKQQAKRAGDLDSLFDDA